MEDLLKRLPGVEVDSDGKITANYDRGWDIEPADDLPTQMAYCILLENYN